MVLLGIDPGLAATGWGLVAREPTRFRCLDFGCLRTDPAMELGERLRLIHEAVGALIREHRPEAMVMERLYQLRDGSTGLVVGQAIGVVRLAACEAGLAVHEYTPTHVKTTLTGFGQADKAQIQFMVQRLLGLSEPPRPDHAADALALCVVHCHSGLSRAAGRPGGADPAGAERIAAALAADEARRSAHLARTEPPA